MNSKTTLPFGAWPSSISADIVASAAPKINHIQSNGTLLTWVESRPNEGGRNVIMGRTQDGLISDLIPRPYSHYSRVHEYGGMAYTLSESCIYFVNASDQRIYQQIIGAKKPTPITEAGPRFADLILDSANNRLIAICEQHNKTSEPENYLVGVSLEADNPKLTPLARGADFYAYPRISPNGKNLCWIEWNHPNMPWDCTQLWQADIHNHRLENKQLIAGGDGHEAIFQPQWSPDSKLYYVSDRDNWWNIFSADKGIILAMPAEFATPLWQFGMSTYDFIDANTIGCLWTQQGVWYCGYLDIATAELNHVKCLYKCMQAACCHGNSLFMVAGAPYIADEIVAVSQQGKVESIYSPSSLDIEQENLAIPESINFSTADNSSVQAFFYPPTSSQYCGNDKELPPVIAMCHGGPTGATDCSLNLKIQYWTNRGFAVVDINYRGSTGFGRDYRNALNGAWGVADIEDMQYVIKYLTKLQKIDPGRCIIRGSSAGGYTVLSALTFTDTFKAGASLYGIGNLESLVSDTHKFESRYLDKLVGAYPEKKEIYQQRSPINHIKRLNCPIIFLQGLEDKVVPPNQAELMINSLKKQGIDVVYIKFPDEGHGFRKSENIVYAMESELTFYSDVFNLKQGG
ncbi:MAG: S9 family peptidase [Porticoccaceae bacterium]